MAAKPIPPTPSQLTSAQPAPIRSATPAPADAPVNDVRINPKRLSRFIARPEEFEFILTNRNELDGVFQPKPVAPPAKRSRKKAQG